MKTPARVAAKPKAQTNTAPSFIEDRAPTNDKLDAIREQLRLARDSEMRIRDLQSVLSEENKSLQRMKFEILPELFADAGIDNLGIPAEGNNPPYEFELKSFYRASIPAEWDDKKRAEAFEVLERKEVGGKDLIKTMIEVNIPREKRGLAKQVIAAIRKFKLEPEVELSVPWNTLTAFVKEAIEKRKLILPLEKLGATAGMQVTMKERKADGASEKENRPSRDGKTTGPEGTRRPRSRG